MGGCACATRSRWLVTTRQAIPADADVVAAIWLEAWRVGYRGIVPDDAIARRTDEQAETYWRRRLADPELAYFVVVAEVSSDGVVGFAQAGPCEPEEPGYATSCGSSISGRRTTGTASDGC